MYQPEALILRRCYPVPITFADLRAAYAVYCDNPSSSTRVFARRNGDTAVVSACNRDWHLAIKHIASAIDEVYAVVDGRDVRVGVMTSDGWQYAYDPPAVGARAEYMDDLFDAADRAGYWARPHEVRLNLQTRPVSHDSVARAVLVGQEYLERTGGAR